MLENTAMIAIWVMLPFLWQYLLRAAGLSIWRVSIPGFVILSFYGYQYIGLPFLYLQLDEFRVSEVYDQWLMMRVFFYTALTMTLMIFGFIAGRKFFGPLKWVDAAGIRESGRMQTACLLVLFGICLSVLLLYLSKVGVEKIALLAVLGLGGDIQAEVARSAMGNAFEGQYHWYHMFMNRLLLFCVYAIFAQYLLRPTRGKRMVFGAVFLVATFAMTMAIEKGPMADFLIALFLVYVLVKREGQFPVRGTILLGAALIAVLSAFYMGFTDADPAEAFFSVGSRAFTGQIEPAYHYLEYFPRHHDFLYGYSFPNPGNIFPFKHYRLTMEMMDWYIPGQAVLGVVGSMPTVYWGEMYANFGFAGIILPPFFVGFALYWLDSLAHRLSPDPVVVALSVWLIMHFKNLSGTSLSGYLFDVYALATLFFFFTIAFISGGGVVRLRNDNFRNAEAG